MQEIKPRTIKGLFTYTLATGAHVGNNQRYILHCKSQIRKSQYDYIY